MKYFLLGVLCILAAGCEQNNPPVNGNQSNSRPTAVSPPADRTNTAVNARDRDSTAVTPMSQSENKGDLNITAEIRKRVIDAKLSLYANNVKIITHDGKVTLRGPVTVEEEKKKIEDIAREVAGGSNVDNQLEVTSK